MINLVKFKNYGTRTLTGSECLSKCYLLFHEFIGDLKQIFAYWKGVKEVKVEQTYLKKTNKQYFR